MAHESSTLLKTPVCLQKFSPFSNYVHRYGVPTTNEHSVPKKSNPGFDSLTVNRDYLWLAHQDGSPILLTVKFIGHSASKHPETIIDKVKKAAVQWEEYANIKFKWVGPDDVAVIRCGFEKDSGHWSYVGRDNQLIQEHENTMNLEFTDSDDDEEIRGTTLHEFGHAIGCIHEQVNPKIAGEFSWNKDVMYKAFKEKYGWDADEVNNNYNSFKPVEGDIVSTNWDKNSIMQYEIEPGWTNPSMTVGRNQNLTKYDKELIAQIYPKK